MELNLITIQDANLALSANQFFKEFADCIISLPTNFFFSYNEVELNEESRDLIVLMTPFGLILIKILAKSTRNLIAKFIRIVLKILASYLRDPTKLFLNNMRIMGPKTTYINKKVAPGIRQYMIEHI